MAAVTFIDSLQTYLGQPGLLAPTPLRIGVVETLNNAELPGIVLSLEELDLPTPGLGERAELIEHGALQWSSRIDLANPVLPGDDDVTLLTPDRRTLTLLHGGLVGSGGEEGPLGPADLQVTLDGTPFDVVTSDPAGGEVRALPAIGQLTFGAPLPATGTLVATYFVGQWERRVERLAGTLRLAVIGSNPADVLDLSNAVLEALPRATGTVPGLGRMALRAAGTVAPFLTERHQRQLRWRFDFEHTIDRPESSGGVIQRIRLQSRPDSAPFEEEEIR